MCSSVPRSIGTGVSQSRAGQALHQSPACRVAQEEAYHFDGSPVFPWGEFNVAKMLNPRYRRGRAWAEVGNGGVTVRLLYLMSRQSLAVSNRLTLGATANSPKKEPDNRKGERPF